MKVFKILLLIFVTFIYTNIFASNIINIEVENINKINLLFTEDVQLPELSVNWNIKLLKDIRIQSINRDENLNSLNIYLNEDLKNNTTYSLFSVLWLDWNIDFSIENSFDNIEIINTEIPTDQWIKKINIVDSRNIKLFFKESLESNEFEFKLLNEVNVSSLDYINTNAISIITTNEIEDNSNYLIMILSLKNNIWEDIKFDEDLYEFYSWIIVKEEIADEKIIIDEKVVEEETSTWEVLKIEEEVEMELNLWIDLKEEVVVEQENFSNNESKLIETEDNLEKIALDEWDVEVETWSATWVILLLTMFISFIFLFRKKISF